jgi:hypothetical protein
MEDKEQITPVPTKLLIPISTDTQMKAYLCNNPELLANRCN